MLAAGVGSTRAKPNYTLVTYVHVMKLMDFVGPPFAAAGSEP